MTDPRSPSTGAPLELPRLVMRRAALAALAALLLTFALGVWRSSADIDEESRGAMALARALAGAIDAAGRDDAGLQPALGALTQQRDLRHVRLTLRDASAAVMFDSAAAHAGPAETPAWLAVLDRPWHALGAPPQHIIALPRPDGSTWQLQIAAVRDSERREALSSLLQMLLLVAVGCTAMLAVMAWNMRRAFAPLRTLVDAIEGLRSNVDAAPDRLAAPMPIRELQVIAQALQGLRAALQREGAQRRVLSRQVMTLQEDERERLARELHDEFGQQLTALRVDAVWLTQRLANAPEHADVADGIAQRCGAIQRDIRELLTRLQPLAPQGEGPHPAEEPAARLAELLAALMGGWARSATQTCSFELRMVVRHADGRPAPWPASDDLTLPRETVLALYRISQEALTNVARHARAQRAVLAVELHLGPQGRPRAVLWEVRDDGLGLADAATALQRGTGLAGIKERAWAHGAELEIGPAWPDQQPSGLRLAARFDVAGGG
jgi:two-component system, NarL family, sensor histidine kinase UhpB